MHIMMFMPVCDLLFFLDKVDFWCVRQTFYAIVLAANLVDKITLAVT